MGAPVLTEAVVNAGFHNADPDASRERIIQSASYRDLSTVCVVPTKDGLLHHKVAETLENLLKPMNQRFYKLHIAGAEVGDAYNQAIEAILGHADLKTYPFLLTVEHDNLPPADGLLKLQAAMYSQCEREDGRIAFENGHPRFRFAAIGGLYWTKGEGGMPMIYGHPRSFPVDFRPQPVIPDTIQECRGIAMGFTLWNTAIFKDSRLGPPWFETKNRLVPGGAEMGTQDLTFCAKAAGLGYRFAVDTSCRVGHMDLQSGIVW